MKPSQGIRIVVPAAPGGTADIVTRLLAAFLQQACGQSKRAPKAALSGA